MMSAQSAAGLSVSQLNQLILESLRREPRLRDVTVTAEISGFKNHFASGHWYFSLKDESAAISCVMFRQNNLRVASLPREGDRVTVRGYVEAYVRDGRVQLYVTAMKPAGVGSLYEQFEALKRKLNAEGLFDPGRKKVLPRTPRKVAVITSSSGAALHDILNVSGMRSPATPIVLIPSGVQGTEAAGELIAALRKAQEIPEVDVIILARGGGSAEDLWCFNDENLARAIAACPLPVVSGVGHEVDFTICDYVADFRASTPSNAAEVVFPDRSELREQVNFGKAALGKAMENQIHRAQLRVHEHRGRLQRLSPDRTLGLLLDRTHQSARLLDQAMALFLRERENQLKQDRTRLRFSMDQALRQKQFELRQAQTRLGAISPLRVLDRGYALVYDAQDAILPDAEHARREKNLKIRFRDGMVDVIGKEYTESHGRNDL